MGVGRIFVESPVFTEDLPAHHRYLALAIQQMLELGLMLVEAAQDRVDRAA
ncbi:MULTISPECIES: DUF6124 family protein [Pseudomonas]|jgi:hypothetical protein|uniref:DUF6124 family protein n=1 Tax=Pseudomonas TaxID=286 RepID=UPI000A819AAA|nr:MULTISPECIES: DUF6124 family protein [Pseudomonas]MBK5544868.1 hypothetical protein [Pseudomonas sp. TH04]MEA3170214.1 hypothetical protein [Pseudomonas sp.]NNB69836.1 hypothetical protein [Pseudomonas fluorescens]UEL24569.1 hypothetical protein K6106_03500 [Pseudomonas fluorescens]